MFQRVDGLVSVQTRKARLTLSLSLRINRRKSQEVVLVTESPDGPYVEKRPLWGYLRKQTHGDAKRLDTVAEPSLRERYG